MAAGISGADVGMVGQAFGMIAQHLQNPAIGGLTTAALMNHALQLRAQSFQPRQALLHLFQLPPCYGVCLVTGAIGLVA